MLQSKYDPNERPSIEEQIDLMNRLILYISNTTQTIKFKSHYKYIMIQSIRCIINGDDVTMKFDMLLNNFTFDYIMDILGNSR